MAIRFRLPDESDTDIVAHSYNGFPTATVDEFRDLLIALGSSGPTAAKPTPLDVFVGAHPIAEKFLESQLPPTVSYVTVSYFGVNTFKFANAKGVQPPSQSRTAAAPRANEFLENRRHW